MFVFKDEMSFSEKPSAELWSKLLNMFFFVVPAENGHHSAGSGGSGSQSGAQRLDRGQEGAHAGGVHHKGASDRTKRTEILGLNRHLWGGKEALILVNLLLSSCRSSEKW